MLLTICNVCTLNLRQANKRLQEDPTSSRASTTTCAEVGAATYDGGVEVRHLLWEIAQRRRATSASSRSRCAASRASRWRRSTAARSCARRRLLGFEDPDRPQSLERLIEACGAEPIDYPAKIKCCGFPIVLAREDVALGEADPAARSRPTDAGADVMVTPCPLCHLSLDAWQKKAETKAGREFNIPILHLAQLLGAAAGIDEDELQVQAPRRAPVGCDAPQADALARAGAGDARLVDVVRFWCLASPKACLASMRR